MLVCLRRVRHTFPPGSSSTRTAPESSATARAEPVSFSAKSLISSSPAPRKSSTWPFRSLGSRTLTVSPCDTNSWFGAAGENTTLVMSSSPGRVTLPMIVPSWLQTVTSPPSEPEARSPSGPGDAPTHKMGVEWPSDHCLAMLDLCDPTKCM